MDKDQRIKYLEEENVRLKKFISKPIDKIYSVYELGKVLLDCDDISSNANILRLENAVLKCRKDCK